MTKYHKLNYKDTIIMTCWSNNIILLIIYKHNVIVTIFDIT